MEMKTIDFMRDIRALGYEIEIVRNDEGWTSYRVWEKPSEPRKHEFESLAEAYAAILEAQRLKEAK